MLKDLLVQISSERPVRPVIDAAISLAMNHSAHLDAISVGLESTNIGLAVDGAAAVAAVFDVERERAQARHRLQPSGAHRRSPSTPSQRSARWHDFMT